MYNFEIIWPSPAMAVPARDSPEPLRSDINEAFRSCKHFTTLYDARVPSDEIGLAHEM